MSFFNALSDAINQFFGGDVPPRVEPTVTTPVFKEPEPAANLIETVKQTAKKYNAPPDWWNDMLSTRPGPARIRVTLNRDLTPAEQETIRQLGTLVRQTLGDKVRVTPDSRIFVESRDVPSRDLFDAVAKVVAESFVNVHPVAVRTFRELV